MARNTKTRSARRDSSSSAPPTPADDGQHREHAQRLTLAHVTHEAVEQLGGIGTVLEGLLCSPVYQQHVQRSILIGPTATHISVEPEKRLGEHGTVLYSSIDQIDRANLAGKFRPVEWAFNVAIVYGTRQYNPPGQDRTGEAEVLLLDVFRANRDRLNVFKHRLWETFGLDSSRYEQHWDYEEYVRLAEPAYYGLQALLGEHHMPCFLFAHEFMGMPAALQATLDGGEQFRTVFHAHECATARRIVENHRGHDTMFYNALRQAREQGLFVEDVFGDMQHDLRHALISRAHLCDGVIAVGDYTRDELHFLNQPFSEHPVELVYNGLPVPPVTPESREASRTMLQDWSEPLLGYRPDVLMSHVTRPVISKAMWRDVLVCEHLDRGLAERGRTGVLYILTSAGGTRRPQDVAHMEQQYGWPRHHRQGFPDLVGPEVDIHRMAEQFNQTHSHLQIVLINQFGFSRQRVGRRVPEGMTIAHFRQAVDVELGMACYEPFGISPLEPLGSGALCVISDVCGCKGFIQQVTGGKYPPNVLVGDFTQLEGERALAHLLNMPQQEREGVEARVAGELGDALLERLPRDADERAELLRSGQELVAKMGWDQVARNHLIPLLQRLQRLTPDERVEANHVHAGGGG